MKDISRILIANRGEIAVRIIRACKKLGIQTVAAVSEADRNSLAAWMADRSVCIGAAPPSASYLDINSIIATALGTGADAIHPGYGFLAENPGLPESCAENGLTFIGPSAENIRQMGDKLTARIIADECGIPTIPGSPQVNDCQTAEIAARDVGYPLLLKAAAGGGGRGIKVVGDADELKTVFDVAAMEAREAFNDDRLYMERYLPNARHIEVQVVSDSSGRVIHLGERDCSVQRRKQKLIEETPCAVLPQKLREEICDAAVAIAGFIHYQNVGTVEFLWDQDHDSFYFLEMNTRVQVEHPITEMITGEDLVATGIKIAGQVPLDIAQKEVTFNGHAVECRINAESPDQDFRPCPGQIREWSVPEMKGIRVDTHCFPGYMVSPYYDSLIAKVITHGTDRQEALALMRFALSKMKVSGVDTTIPFHLSIITQPDFLKGSINTQWVENELNK